MTAINLYCDNSLLFYESLVLINNCMSTQDWRCLFVIFWRWYDQLVVSMCLGVGVGGRVEFELFTGSDFLKQHVMKTINNVIHS